MSKPQKTSKTSRLFGRSRDPKQAAPTTGEAIQNIRGIEDMLGKKQEFLEAKVAAETETAKKNAKTNKAAALRALKRREKVRYYAHKKSWLLIQWLFNRYEQQLTQIDGTLTTLEQQRETLESASTNNAVFKSIAQGAKAMKVANDGMDLDKLHDMMDDIEEQRAVSDEISRAISQVIRLWWKIYCCFKMLSILFLLIYSPLALESSMMRMNLRMNWMIFWRKMPKLNWTSNSWTSQTWTRWALPASTCPRSPATASRSSPSSRRRRRRWGPWPSGPHKQKHYFVYMSNLGADPIYALSKT